MIVCTCVPPTLQPPTKVSQAVMETVVPKEPPPDFEFMVEPPSISGQDL